MSLFSKRGSAARKEPPEERTARKGDRDGQAGKAKAHLSAGLARALELLRVAADSRASEQMRAALLEVERDLGEAFVAEDFAEVRAKLGAIEWDTGASATRAGTGGELLPLFLEVTRGVRPIVAGLGLRGPGADLRRLEKTTALLNSKDQPVQRLLRVLETASVHAARLRDASDVMKSCVGELIATLGALASQESGVKASLDEIRSELASAKEIRDLEGLRERLLDQAQRLVTVAQGRESAIRTAQKHAETQRDRASELEHALAGAEEAARTDPLTGLLNRRALDELTQEHLTGPVGILALDLDHFKRINDAWGHAAGDEVLVHVAELLRGELRGDDYAFRVGGEELVVLLPGSSWQGARATGERLRSRLEVALVRLDPEREVSVTMSVGIGLWSGRDSFALALAEADRALYRAKDAGRNRVVG